MKLFIIILHFGDSKVTNACLESLIKHEKKYQEILIIDNDKDLRFMIYARPASLGEAGDLRSKDRRIKIIRNKENLGYAGGMNVGVRYALSHDATHVLLLNNDLIIEKEFLIPLLKFLEVERQAGIVAAAIKFKKNKKIIYDFGGKVNMLFGRTSHYEVEKVVDKSPRKVDYISGCCMLVKKEVFEKIGLFDEQFFLYYEDVDFCLRARKVGFEIYVVPTVVVFHQLSVTIGKNSTLAVYYQTKSALIFGKKHIKSMFLNRLFIFFQSLIFIFRNPVSARMVLKGLFDYVKIF